MKFATFCSLLAFCAFAIVHADKNNEDLQKKFDKLYKNDPRGSMLYDVVNKKWEKMNVLMKAARQAKKNPVGCQQALDESNEQIYSDYLNNCGDCVLKAKKKNNYQAAEDCCKKLYKDALSQTDEMVKEAKYCLGGL